MSINSLGDGLIPAQFLSHLPPPRPQSGCPDDVSSNQSCSGRSQSAGSLLYPLREGRHFRKNWKILPVTHSLHLTPPPSPQSLPPSYIHPNPKRPELGSARAKGRRHWKYSLAGSMGLATAPLGMRTISGRGKLEAPGILCSRDSANAIGIEGSECPHPCWGGGHTGESHPLTELPETHFQGHSGDLRWTA